MRLIRGLYSCPSNLFAQGSVATIGNFDGVHLGHQAIIQRLTSKAKALSLPSVVVVFEPHPQEFFRPDAAPARLFKLTDKLLALKDLGVDYVLCLRFNRELAELSAEDFIRRVLVETLRVQHLFIGDDFKFGYQRKGDFALLKQTDHFPVEANQTVVQNIDTEDVRISSSLVRQAIADNDFARAEKLLGRPYRFRGRVAHGDKQGRTIGIPTANIALKRIRSPLHGVYAVKVLGISGTSIKGVANVGKKPTLNERKERLEVHLLNFDGDVYGKHLTIEPIAKIRDEQKFGGKDELIEQIHRDIERAKQLFAK
ncbi:bifunctional riboflavin kinase/FAD synthetase [Kangiella sp.]|uniref:bifunctional riboflavin kinase/FAD synthetase n=1 Tax=Kangiella sp. TaxID=1920245 RepID=UPI0019852306|nr:bifunctional riboflavin kinase/FAD synthetase [Kangiella sp.]MBD3654679.1 bifunctional riboflavin kinase/FAD synthetase [Kangiella sp.]